MWIALSPVQPVLDDFSGTSDEAAHKPWQSYLSSASWPIGLGQRSRFEQGCAHSSGDKKRTHWYSNTSSKSTFLQETKFVSLGAQKGIYH